MPTMPRLVVALVACLAPFAAFAEAPQDPATQTIMHSVLDPLARVLPLSFDHEAFESPANRAKIGADLKTLMANTEHLQAHGRSKDRAFEFIAQSLRNDARHAYRWYEQGQYDEARFVLHNITENCVACHANLPETHQVPPSSAFFSAIKVDRLPPLEKAHYYVVSRQFDDALATYEAYFADTSIPSGSLAMLGSFTDYLKVAANAKGDLKRPLALIKKLLEPKDMPAGVRMQLTVWAQALTDLDQAGVLAKSDIGTARKVLSDGRERMEFARDRDGLIHYLVAAAILNRYVHAHPDHGPAVGEAYYMLGITESLLSRTFWISREEFDFESAIRLAPGASYAPKALALLEESYTVGFSGSSGTHLPDDVKQKLAELHRLVDDAQSHKS